MAGGNFANGTQSTKYNTARIGIGHFQTIFLHNSQLSNSAHQIFMFKRMFQFNSFDEVRAQTHIHNIVLDFLFILTVYWDFNLWITKMRIVHKSWKRKDFQWREKREKRLVEKQNKKKKERNNNVKMQLFRMNGWTKRKIGWTAFETENKWRRPTGMGFIPFNIVQPFLSFIFTECVKQLVSTYLLFTCIRYTKILSELNEKFCYFHLSGRAKLKRKENVLNKINENLSA